MSVSILAVELMPKRLELLTELVPQVRVIVLLVNPSSPSVERIMRDAHEGARAKGVQRRSAGAPERACRRRRRAVVLGGDCR